MNKKYISLVLAIFMLFGALTGLIPVSAEGAPEAKVEQASVLLEKLSEINSNRGRTEAERELLEQYKAQSQEELRVLIEVDRANVLDYMSEMRMSYDELSQSKKNNIEANLESEIQYAEQQISRKGIDIEKLEEYNVVFSGFAAKIKAKDLKKLKETPGVKNVYISKRYELEKPMMVTSHDMINDEYLWKELKMKGEGMLVAVIDSGTDVAHKDMKISDPARAALSKEKVEKLISEKGLKGKFYTEKVPYGYNYFDGNFEIKDIGPSASEHGMHVAGTVAANGDNLKGVAPEAQILGMKVFGNDPLWGTTYDDIYMSAIEDAIILGADVLNMSLGSASGFDDLGSTMDKMFTKAVNAGIVCAVAAGNESHIYKGFANDKPFAEDYDYGVLGTPSIYEDTISVASINNAYSAEKKMVFGEEGKAENEALPNDTYIFPVNGVYKAFSAKYLDTNPLMKAEMIKALRKGTIIYKNKEGKYVNRFGIEIDITGKLNETIIYVDENGKESTRAVKPNTDQPGTGTKQEAPYREQIPSLVSLGTIEYVDCGIGKPDQIPDSVKGKLALIQRGEISFSEKAKNAQGKGAAGVLIYNHVGGGDTLMGMILDADIKIPVGSAYHSTGVAMAASTVKKVKFTEDVVKIKNADGGYMSDFSSMGPSPTLRLKPELTAPGGNIFSTLNDDKYGTMSGTSMATPHVAGASALVQEYLKEKMPSLSSEERTRLVKTLLMNTATIVKDKSDVPVTVRKQGAGLMNIKAAVTTPAYITVKNAQPKLELRQIDSNSFSFNYTVHSLGKACAYNVRAIALQDVISGGLNTMKQQEIKAAVTGNTSVSLSANGQVSGNLTVTVPDAQRNSYIDGWIVFEDPTNTNPTLVIPYLAFYGDWDGLRIFDDFAFEPNAKSKYGIADFIHLVYNSEKKDYDPMLANKKRAISPDDSIAKIFGRDRILPAFTIIRNADKLRAYIKDERGNILRVLTDEYGVRKNYYNSGRGRTVYFTEDFAWDGKVFADGAESAVKDGTYTYVLEATPAGSQKIQTKEVSVIVDSIAPEITDLKLDAVNKTLSFKCVDPNKGSGVNGFMVDMAKLVGNIPEDKPKTTKGIMFIDENDKRILENDGAGNYKLNISELFDENYRAEDSYKFVLYAFDYAFNLGLKSTDTEAAKPGTDKDALIYLPVPDLRLAVNDKSVEFSGYVLWNGEMNLVADENGKELKTFRLNYDGSIPIEDDKGVVVEHRAGYRFNERVNLNDGYHMVRLVAKDKSGKELSSVQRAVLVDTVLPVVNVLSTKADDKSNTAEVTISVTEQSKFFNVKANKSDVFNYDEGDFAKPGSYTKEVSFKVYNLKPGDNTVLIEVTDIAGNVQRASVKINSSFVQAADKSELKELVNYFESLDRKQYNEFSKSYIDMALEYKALLNKEKVSADEADKAVEAMNKLKSALVTLEDEKSASVKLNERVETTVGIPSLVINPTVDGKVSPSKYYVDGKTEKLTNLGEKTVLDYKQSGSVEVTFTTRDGIDMFTKTVQYNVTEVKGDKILSIDSVTKGGSSTEFIVYAKVFSLGKPGLNETVAFEVYDPSRNVVSKGEAATNDRGYAVYNFTLKTEPKKGEVYSVDAHLKADPSVIANKTFTPVK